MALDAEAAAHWLAEAWTSGYPLAALPPDMAPRDIADGEDIAAALVAALELPVSGLRLAPTPDGARIAGIVLDARLHGDGATLAASLLRHGRMSVAVIGVLGEALDETGDAGPVFAGLHAAIDIATSRFTAAPDDAALIAADLGGLGYIVAGPRMPVPAAPVEVALAEGRKRPRGAMVDVLAALAEVATAARALGGLPAGAVLVAAGLTPAITPEPGTTYVARMGALGRARVTIA